MLESTIRAKTKMIKMFKKYKDDFHKKLCENLKLEIKYLSSLKDCNN